MTTPETRWEHSIEVQSGSRVAVRAAAMTTAGQVRGAVTVTVRVPADFFQVIAADGSVSATLLLNPNEAADLAGVLDEAGMNAQEVGPALYG